MSNSVSIWILGSVLSSLVFAFLGYHLNAYNSRDRISIEEISLVAKSTL